MSWQYQRDIHHHDSYQMSFTTMSMYMRLLTVTYLAIVYLDFRYLLTECSDDDEYHALECGRQTWYLTYFKQENCEVLLLDMLWA